MKKVLFNNNGSLDDISTSLSDYHKETSIVDFTLNEDALYIGSELPFNSLYFLLSAYNTAVAAISIKYWDGSEWQSMVEVQDETELVGASMGKSGHVSWVTNKNYKWAIEDTVSSNGNESVTGLGGVTIYDLYWLKVEFDASLDVTTSIDWIGAKFCNNDDVISEYTLLGKNNFISAYETNKKNWDKEIVLASRLITGKLIEKGAIVSGDQLMDNNSLKDACVSKVAQLVYKNLGDDYTDDASKASSEYNARINYKTYKVDVNKNARIDINERKVGTGGLYR